MEGTDRGGGGLMEVLHGCMEGPAWGGDMEGAVWMYGRSCWSI